jgi:uncharacterized membrane protein YoaK (UPF0700 family)
VVVSLVAFALGAVLAMQILRAFDGDVEVEDEAVVEVWPRRVSIALAVALLVQVGFLGVWMATSPSSVVTNILLALSAFAMGLQMNAIRSLHVPAVSTTAATATLISLASGVAPWSHKAPAARRLTGVLASMVVGAVVGDWMLSHVHTYAPVLPVLVIALVIVIASVALKRQRPVTPAVDESVDRSTGADRRAVDRIEDTRPAGTPAASHAQDTHARLPLVPGGAAAPSAERPTREVGCRAIRFRRR